MTSPPAEAIRWAIDRAKTNGAPSYVTLVDAYEEAIEALQKLLDDIDKHATGSFGDSQDNARAVLAKAREQGG